MRPTPPLPPRAALTRLLLAVLFLASPLVLAEQFYKWQDDKGVWHYSAKPPKDQPADKLSVHTQAGRGADEGDEGDDEEGDGDAAKAAAAGTGETIESINCKAARNNLETLNNNPVVSKDLDGDGVAENLSLEQHQEEIAFAERQIAAFCKPEPAADAEPDSPE